MSGSPSSSSTVQELSQSSIALSRPRRWILSWLLGHGAVIEHVDNKRDAVNSTQTDEEPSKNDAINNTRYDDDSSAEVHNLPGTVAVDLSGDTRVNYQEGRSKAGALAHESDAEVFDWNLLQDDKDKNAGDVNPHYYQSNSVTSGHATSGYGRARPATGLLYNSRGEGDFNSRVNSFNRFPISYEQSLEYVNSRRRHWNT